MNLRSKGRVAGIGHLRLGGILVVLCLLGAVLLLYEAFQSPTDQISLSTREEGRDGPPAPRLEGFTTQGPEVAPGGAPEASRVPEPPPAGEEPTPQPGPALPASSDIKAFIEPSSVQTGRAFSEVRDALEQGEPEQALRLLDSALQDEPDNESLWLSKAGVYLHLKRYTPAWFALQKVRDPVLHNAYYFFLEGEIHYQEERLLQARESFRKSLELEENEAVRVRFEKVSREYEAQAAFLHVRSEHFTLSIPDRSIEPMARSILDNLERLFTVLSQEFGVVSIGPIVVILYPEIEFKRVTHAPDWAGGIYDQKIRVPVKGLRKGDPKLKRVLRHELVHALVHFKSSGSCPRWLNEGLAQHYEGVSLDSRISGLRGISSAWRTKLLSDFRPGESPYVFYTRSLAMTEYLIEKEGSYKVVELLSALARSRDEGQAFRDTFHRDRSQILEGWKADFERRYPPE